MKILLGRQPDLRSKQKSCPLEISQQRLGRCALHLHSPRKLDRFFFRLLMVLEMRLLQSQDRPKQSRLPGSFFHPIADAVINPKLAHKFHSAIGIAPRQRSQPAAQSLVA